MNQEKKIKEWPNTTVWKIAVVFVIVLSIIKIAEAGYYTGQWIYHLSH